MNRTSQLKQKEVIDITNGKRLGFLCDVEIELESGRIHSIVVPNSARVFGFISKENEMVIPWSKVKLIGKDIIFVEIEDISI
jgi:YlmC/YmxH family sporulation protein